MFTMISSLQHRPWQSRSTQQCNQCTLLFFLFLIICMPWWSIWNCCGWSISRGRIISPPMPASSSNNNSTTTGFFQWFVSSSSSAWSSSYYMSLANLFCQQGFVHVFIQGCWYLLFCGVVDDNGGRRCYYFFCTWRSPPHEHCDFLLCSSCYCMQFDGLLREVRSLLNGAPNSNTMTAMSTSTMAATITAVDTGLLLPTHVRTLFCGTWWRGHDVKQHSIIFCSPWSVVPPRHFCFSSSWWWLLYDDNCPRYDVLLQYCYWWWCDVAMMLLLLQRCSLLLVSLVVIFLLLSVLVFDWSWFCSLWSWLAVLSFNTMILVVFMAASLLWYYNCNE